MTKRIFLKITFFYEKYAGRLIVPNAGIIKDKAEIEGKAERLARISLATGTYLV
jgi:hypothetical protein